MSKASDIELLFAIWEQNVRHGSRPQQSLNQQGNVKTGPAQNWLRISSIAPPIWPNPRRKPKPG